MAAMCFPLASLTMKPSRSKTFNYGFCVRLSRSTQWSTLNIKMQASLNSAELSLPGKTQEEIIRRPPAEFHPSLWGDSFIDCFPCHSKPDKWMEQRIQELKKDVKNILSSASSDPFQNLILIDAIQRLGVSYHFESEVEDGLQHIYDDISDADGDLYIVALRFRLLRQAGYYVSPGVFQKFKDANGSFCASLALDVQGMLSLYEAAYLSYKEEYILDDAIAFTSQHLKSMVTHLDNSLRSLVQKALDLPLQKRFPRVETRHYISVYQENVSKNESILEFAKLDYNAVQLLHQSEIGEISRWWKAINIVSKLPFQMRERLVEGYAMVQMIFCEPKNTTGRIYMGKLFALLTVIDDTFDVYGTLEELQPLTDAIVRWDAEQLNELPEYLQITIAELFKLFDEVDEEMTRRGQPYSISYFKNQMKSYARNLWEEAKLFNSKQVPTLEEWFKISLTTVGGPILTIGAVVDMFEYTTKETLKWAVNSPLLTNCSRIARFADDIGSFKTEAERGNIVSCVSIYMKELGVSEEHAIKIIRKMMDKEWKEMNKQILKPTTVPMPLITVVLNITRMAEVLYLYEDGYTYTKGHTKQIIDWLLVDPVPL